MAQEARGRLCTGQNQLARKQPGCGHTDWAEPWQGQHNSGILGADSSCSANAQQSLCAPLPCQWDSGVTCQQIFTCHAPNNEHRTRAGSGGKQHLEASVPVLVCL